MTEPNAQKPARRSTGLRYIFTAIALMGLGGGILLFSTAPDPAALSVAEAQATRLETLRLEARSVTAKVAVPGLLQPRRSVEIFAEVDGRVTEIGAEALDRVKADQLLMRMDPLWPK